MNSKIITTLVLIMAIGLVGSAYAHKSQVIGDYEIEVGWDQEPPMVGHENAIVVNVSMAPADEQGGHDEDMNMTEGHDQDMNMTEEGHDEDHAEGGHDEEKVINGISGLSDKLAVDVSLNGKKEILTLVEDPDNLGHYTGNYTPMETGFPLVHIFGIIGDQDVEITFHPEEIEHLTPLEQMKEGIATEDVLCGQGLTLMKKLTDDSPACVTPKTADVLVVRGWGAIV